MTFPRAMVCLVLSGEWVEGGWVGVEGMRRGEGVEIWIEYYDEKSYFFLKTSGLIVGTGKHVQS